MASAEWYKANREKVLARVKARAVAKREEIRAYKASYQEKNRERLCLVKREHYKANRAAIRAKQKAAYDANPDVFRAMVKKYRQANPEKASAAVKAWCKANPQRLAMTKLALARRARKDNPQKYAEYAARRRARVQGARSEPIDYGAVLFASKGLCGICHKPFNLFGIDFDHIVPLAAGGSHTQDNLQATHSRCNRSKGARVA